MGTLTIIESTGVGRENAQPIPVHKFRQSDDNDPAKLTTNNSNSVRQILKGSTGVVTLIPSEDMYVKYGGSSVSATSASFKLLADQPFSFCVEPGADNYVAGLDVA